MEHIYRGFRISIKEHCDGWHAKFWAVRGTPLTLKVEATLDEGVEMCLSRAVAALDKYLAYRN